MRKSEKGERSGELSHEIRGIVPTKQPNKGGSRRRRLRREGCGPSRTRPSLTRSRHRAGIASPAGWNVCVRPDAKYSSIRGKNRVRYSSSTEAAFASAVLLAWLWFILSVRAGHASSVLVRRAPDSENNMNSQAHPNDSDNMRADYDFCRGVRGKHYQAYRTGMNVVFLAPDVAVLFPDSASVNQALRLLVRLAKTKGVVEGRPGKPLEPVSRTKSRVKRQRSAATARD